jgi:hypothetical protein
MKVDKVIEIENKAVQFTGELSQEEADIVIGLGLNHLVRMGAMGPFAELIEQLKEMVPDTFEVDGNESIN